VPGDLHLTRPSDMQGHAGLEKLMGWLRVKVTIDGSRHSTKRCMPCRGYGSF
jgi:hypothetical protein